VKKIHKTIVKENYCEIFFQFLTEIFSQQLVNDSRFIKAKIVF